jgi:hypothetical protein
VVKLEIAVASQDRGVRSKGAKRGRMIDLEAKLDELRRDLSSMANEAIFPHAVLSAQQISLLSCQKPTTPAEVRIEFDANARLCPSAESSSDILHPTLFKLLTLAISKLY